MYIRRHIPFLKSVLYYAISAFGGPSAHFGMISRIFVQKRKDISESELLEYNAFCQLLPGATSTQLLTSIAYKRGGMSLAILTCLIWIIPASLLMGIFSFLITSEDIKTETMYVLRYIQPMALGFLLHAIFRAYSIAVKSFITKAIVLFGAILMYCFIRTPWILPLLLISAGVLTSFSNKRIPDNPNIKKKKINWINISLFLGLFILLGFLSETARKNNWESRKALNLMENNYRFGSIVFGGGDVLLPMMIDQYVARPADKKVKERNPGIISINRNDLLTGYGLSKAIPGPVFSIASYIGGLTLSSGKMYNQIIGCIIGSISIFLPGILLLFFFLPLWNNLKHHTGFLRALEGINAVTVGLMIAAFCYLSKDIIYGNDLFSITTSIVLIISTIILLQFTKIPPPFVVAICIILGIVSAVTT